MKTLNRIMAILMVFAFTAVSSYAQRDGGRRGDSHARSSVSTSQRQSHGESMRRGAAAPSRHENVAPRNPAPTHHSQLSQPMSGHPNVAPRPGHASHADVHRHPVHSAHRYQPVHPTPAHHVHGHPHYVQHVDRRAQAFFVDNCRYYHHNGAFYRYYPGHGYGLVSIPYYSLFPVLPFPCRQVVVGHDVYWEGDGSWFYETPTGYVLVEAPAVQVYEAPIPPAPVVEPARPHVSVHLSF